MTVDTAVKRLAFEADYNGLEEAAEIVKMATANGYGI